MALKVKASLLSCLARRAGFICDMIGFEKLWQVLIRFLSKADPSLEWESICLYYGRSSGGSARINKSARWWPPDGGFWNFKQKINLSQRFVRLRSLLIAQEKPRMTQELLWWSGSKHWERYAIEADRCRRWKLITSRGHLQPTFCLWVGSPAKAECRSIGKFYAFLKTFLRTKKFTRFSRVNFFCLSGWKIC